MGRRCGLDDPTLQPVEIEQIRQQSLELAGVRCDPAHEVERVLLRQLQLGLFERQRRAEDRRERGPEIVRHSLQERVLHVVQRAEALRGLALPPERFGILALAPSQGLLGALAFGDVDHQATELPRPLCSADHVHHVPDPDRAAVGRRHPVLEVLVLSRVRSDAGGGDRRVAIFEDRVVSPTAPLGDPLLIVCAEELLGPASDEREPERRCVGLPEDGVEARDQLVEPLQLGETPGVTQRQRRDVGDPAGQAQVPSGEPPVVILRTHHQRYEPVGLPAERGDQRLAGLTRWPEFAGPPSDDLARDRERLGPAREERSGDVGRDHPGRRHALRTVAEVQEMEVAGLLVAEVRGEPGRGDQMRDRIDGLPQDVLDGVELRQGLGQVQERRRCLRRFTLSLEEFRVLECHGGMRRQNLEQPLVLLVELAVAEHRQRDHAQQGVAHRHGHCEHGLQDVVGAGDLHREVHLSSIRRDQRSPVLGDIPRDAFADLRDQRLDGVLLVVGEHLPAERHGIERPSVRLEEVDTAAVVVDDRAELGGDGRADLVRVCQGVERRGEAVEHVELRDRPQMIGGAAGRAFGLRSHFVTGRHHDSHPLMVVLGPPVGFRLVPPGCLNAG